MTKLTTHHSNTTSNDTASYPVNYRGILVLSQIYQPMVDLAKQQKVSLRDLLAGTNINVSEFMAGDYALRPLQQVQFLKNIQQHCKLQNFGLKAGLKANFSDLGILGLTMLSAPSLRAAIGLGAKYGAVGGSLGHLSIKHKSGLLGLKFSLPPLFQAAQQLLVEEQFVALQVYGAQLLDADYHPKSGTEPLATKLSFTHPEPEQPKLYSAYFRCPIEFNAPENVFWYRSDLLKQAPILANKTASKMCQTLCDQHLSEVLEQDPWLAELYHFIRQSLPHAPSQAELAKHNKLSLRQLRYRLQRADTNYNQLCFEARRDHAVELLSNSTLSIQAISEKLGYSEATNFRRAFKRWTGQAPKFYRQSA